MISYECLILRRSNPLFEVSSRLFLEQIMPKCKYKLKAEDWRNDKHTHRGAWLNKYVRGCVFVDSCMSVLGVYVKSVCQVWSNSYKSHKAIINQQSGFCSYRRRISNTFLGVPLVLLTDPSCFSIHNVSFLVLFVKPQKKVKKS